MTRKEVQTLAYSQMVKRGALVCKKGMELGTGKEKKREKKKKKKVETSQSYSATTIIIPLSPTDGYGGLLIKKQYISV